MTGVQTCALPISGTRIPGVARDQIAAQLRLQQARWSTGVQVVGVGGVTVNDVGSEHAPGYALLNLDITRDWAVGSGRLHTFARIDNALDKTYIGSVIVNEGNSRFYEPGPERTFLLGLRWDWQR